MEKEIMADLFQWPRLFAHHPAQLQRLEARHLPTSGKNVPLSICPTEADVQQWFIESFEQLGDNPLTLEVGTVALWRGFKHGARGGESTKVEYFRGLIHAVLPPDGKGDVYCHAT